MVAENVYSIFKALPPEETKRFLDMMERERKKPRTSQAKKTKKQQLNDKTSAIVNEYLRKWKERCQKEIQEHKLQSA